jgi:hypothetical protein
MADTGLCSVDDPAAPLVSTPARRRVRARPAPACVAGGPDRIVVPIPGQEIPMPAVLQLQRTCLALYLAAVALQVYAAGLALFGATSFVPHAILGYLLILGALVLLGLTAAARLPRRATVLAVLILAVTALQPVLALGLRGRAPALAALHPLNALLIVALAAWIARSTQKAT